MEPENGTIGDGSDFASLDFNFECEDAVPCMLCEEMFEVMQNPQPLLQHLLVTHKFVIGAVEQVADLRQYVLYWGKLREVKAEDYCVVVSTNSQPGRKTPSETFLFLCDKLPEDSRLRLTLRQMKLRFIVEQKEKERNDDTFSRQCIYCSQTISGGVTQCLHHLTIKHGFSLGNPDNIVYGARLLDLLQDKLANLVCLYCEKVFRNHKMLREHMRKHQHRCLNPKNKIYDKFYLRNYLRPGTPWEETKRDLEGESDTESLGGGEGGAEWREDDTPPTTCLFCHYTTIKVPGGLFNHMRIHHNIDFEQITSNFNFYQKVKIVNYIRSCVSEHRCPQCQLVFGCQEHLEQHLSHAGHCNLPHATPWDLPEFHFPVVENDGLLFHLEDNELDENDASDKQCPQPVFPEDMPSYQDSILRDPQLRHQINLAEEDTREVGSGSGDEDWREEAFGETGWEEACGGIELEEEEGAVMCLFCRYTSHGSYAHCQVRAHMTALHCFDLIDVVADLPFYTQVKLINYIRWKTSKSECYVCSQVFEELAVMEEHRVLANHNSLPQLHLFQDKRWLRPVLECDGLLQRLREVGDSDDEDPSKPDTSRGEAVFSEEVLFPSSILSNVALRQELLDNMANHISEHSSYD